MDWGTTLLNANDLTTSYILFWVEDFMSKNMNCLKAWIGVWHNGYVLGMPTSLLECPDSVLAPPLPIQLPGNANPSCQRVTATTHEGQSPVY